MAHLCSKASSSSSVGQLGFRKVDRWYLDNRAFGKNHWNRELPLAKLAPILRLLVDRDGWGVAPGDGALGGGLARLDLAHLLRTINRFLADALGR